MGLDQVGGERQGAASRQRAQDGERDELGREAGRRDERAQARHQEVHGAGAAKHADRHQNADQERNDLHRDLESLLRSVDEDVVDLHLSDDAHERDPHEEDGNRPERDGVEHRADHGRTSAVVEGCG